MIWSSWEESGARTASNEMCTFLVMNISSLQLIPVNIIAYRSQYGSANPAAVIAPAIVATFFSTVVAVVFISNPLSMDTLSEPPQAPYFDFWVPIA